MKILAIDTSSKNSSVAICDNENILSEFNINNSITHSQTIMPMLSSALELAKIKLQNIDIFAVSSGPGSFTGIRIGMSAIKGLALGLNKPCVSISSLESLAYNFLFYNGMICSVIDAKCENVYSSIFKINNQNVIRLSEDRLISINDLCNNLLTYNKDIMIVGDATNILCSSNISNSFIPSPINLRLQKATSIAKIALEKYNNNQMTNSENLIPLYLNKPQAEKNLIKN